MKATLTVFVLLALAVVSYAIVAAPEGDIIECEVCHGIVYAVDDWLAQNKTADEIERDLETLCTLLGSKGKATCDGIIISGVPQLIKWIETNETPEQTCGPDQLNVC